MFARKLLVLGFVLCLCIGGANALGIQKGNFFDVEQGGIYNITIYVYTATGDFENDFTIVKSGPLADWITVSPTEFTLDKGSMQPLSLTLIVPEDAKLGDYSGTIKAVGHRPVPVGNQSGEGSTVGYTVSTLSGLHARVVKPGAVEAVTILSVIVPKRVERGSTAKFDVSIKNTGNVPTTVSPALTVSKDAETVATIPGVPVELSVDEEKTAKLYWDAQEKGTYTAVVAVTCGETTTTSEPISIEVGKGGFSIPSVPAFAVVAAILAAFAFALLRRKR
ncbi:MAG: hypothetical protein KAT65_20105 [Methanophagales archaeon]|nr:hypothetical protein [Methanophagales archaeon]